MKVRTKVLEKEAWRWMFQENQEEVPAWVNDAMGQFPKQNSLNFLPDGNEESRIPRIEIFALGGWVSALPGDWIIRGVRGEIYPCKPDIFEKSYEVIG